MRLCRVCCVFSCFAWHADSRMMAGGSSFAPGVPPLRLAGGPGAQAVEFYESEDFLVGTVESFVREGLAEGARWLSSRRLRIGARSSWHWVRREALGEAADCGPYFSLDAQEVLGKFMVSNRPDAGRFRDIVGTVLDRAACAGGPVRVYSEMVALLWSRHDLASTLALGELWQNLKLSREFTLLCAYPMRTFADDGSDIAFERICAQHGAVIPATPFRGGQRLGAATGNRRPAAADRKSARHRNAVRAEQERLEELAHVDALTGLGNRRAFDRHLVREWQLSRRNGYDSQLVLADLDHFKEYNDSHGHKAGDSVLTQFADVLRAAARSTDIVCRVGGDEFAVILINCRSVDSRKFEERLSAAMVDSTNATLDDIEVSLGHASLGRVASGAEAFEQADRAMYDAKQARRGRDAQQPLVRLDDRRAPQRTRVSGKESA